MQGATDGEPWHCYDTVFLNAKAGMEGVDKEKVQKVVYEMSKGSRYFDNERRKEAELQRRIEKLRVQASQVSSETIAKLKDTVDQRIGELESSRDLTRIWMHVDLDAFYAAVETLGDSSFLSKPMAVGSMSMICTANYEARKYGVRAAMPGFIACKLCTELVLVKPDFVKYTHYSELTRQVFRLYDEHFMSRGMDEAHLDITAVCQQKNCSAAEVGEQLRREVYEKTKLTCSAGIAPNRLLAKVCSDINKPNGQFVLPNNRDDVMKFIASLPIRKVSGIGKVTEKLLKEVLSIHTCSDFILKRYIISALFSHTSQDFFLSVGLGIGGTETPREEARKSISSERTFSDTSDETVLNKMLGDLAEGLAEDMAKEGLHGRTLTLKLKTSHFEVRSRAVSIAHGIHFKEDIEAHAIRLLKAELPVSLRLIGIRISHFKENDTSQKSIISFFQLTAAASKQADILSQPNEDEQEDSNVELETEHEVAEATTSNQEQQKPETSWTEDERCCLCGAKISVAFLSRRQEHEDYHFAEKLERQLSGYEDMNSQIEALKKRVSQREPGSTKTKKKKPTSHARNAIDVYFAQKNTR